MCHGQHILDSSFNEIERLKIEFVIQHYVNDLETTCSYSIKWTTRYIHITYKRHEIAPTPQSPINSSHSGITSNCYELCVVTNTSIISHMDVFIQSTAAGGFVSEVKRLEIVRLKLTILWKHIAYLDIPNSYTTWIYDCVWGTFYGHWTWIWMFFIFFSCWSWTLCSRNIVVCCDII